MDACVLGGYPTPAGYEQPPSGWRSALLAAYPAPAGYETAAVQIDQCAPGGYQAPAKYERPTYGWMSVRPAATPCTRDTAQPTQHTERAQR